MRSVAEINTTDKAKKKIAGIAKCNGLDFDLVYHIFCFHWNFDGSEADWVSGLDRDVEYRKRLDYICGRLALTSHKQDKEQIIAQLQERLTAVGHESLMRNFLSGSTNKNYCRVSEFASYHYLKNSDGEKLNTLEWQNSGYNIDKIIQNLFFKIFRGGAVDRYNLEYLYADLAIDLPYISLLDDAENWIPDFLNDIGNNADGVKLADLRSLLKSYCKGDKYFLQTTLEALSYAGVLKVKGHPTDNIFIPDFRNKLSENYYSNEWSYPLRFWSGNK